MWWSGFGEIGYCHAKEEITRDWGSTADFVGTHNIGTNVIYTGGFDVLKSNYLPGNVPEAKSQQLH